jgi:hypothetical protein
MKKIHSRLLLLLFFSLTSIFLSQLMKSSKLASTFMPSKEPLDAALQIVRRHHMLQFNCTTHAHISVLDILHKLSSIAIKLLAYKAYIAQIIISCKKAAATMYLHNKFYGTISKIFLFDRIFTFFYWANPIHCNRL